MRSASSGLEFSCMTQSHLVPPLKTNVETYGKRQEGRSYLENSQQQIEGLVFAYITFHFRLVSLTFSPRPN